MEYFEKRKNKYRALGVDPDNPVFKLEEDYEREEEVKEAIEEGRELSDMDS